MDCIGKYHKQNQKIKVIKDNVSIQNTYEVYFNIYKYNFVAQKV